ncbi:MAG TPA: GNAT family N-acetyltransferase [Chthonomonadaceae bacterium]|nr:GNAT family N-acetyltransferase [Chthonomonadaceae bacterium]
MDQLAMRRPNLEGLPEIPSLPPGYTLRARREGDLEGLAALLQRAFPETEWTPARAHAELVTDPDVKQTFVILFAGQPVATASALVPARSPEVGTIHWVGVDPAHRGQRLGYLISLAVLNEFVRLGCTSAQLLTDDHRLPAIKTYLKLGFVPELRGESHGERWARITALLP